MKLRTAAVTTVILLSATSTVLAFTISEVIAQAAQGNDTALSALENSITVLKWGGAAVVSALATAVAVLYRANEKANNQQRTDLISGLKAREDLIVRNIETSKNLRKSVEDLSSDVKKLVERG